MPQSSRRPPNDPVLSRVLAALCCAVLLTSCNVPRTDQAQPEPARTDTSDASPSTPVPPSAPEASEAPSPASGSEQELLISDGVRLDRLQNNGGRTLATVTNLNSLPVDLEMSIALYRGGDLPNFVLGGRATLGSDETGSVLLEEEQGRQVDCSGGCSYDFRTVAQVAETGQEPHTNEQSCTPVVCALDPEPSVSPSS